MTSVGIVAVVGGVIGRLFEGQRALLVPLLRSLMRGILDIIIMLMVVGMFGGAQL